jgi:hypothetical protein
MAVGDKRYSVSSGKDLEEAKEHSLKICSDKGDNNCKIFYTDCAFPQRAR